ncbi:CrcB protein [Sinobacterium caligoides]|uniref:Fluoride-specific ion channel FluC n=1 Tax=Sinobacterium caligoides TaxID=933926 RepID=A0A3N2E007_9GAMM|nr:CrcB family protein [Sinobacterium caligoides]ROS05242.1 CrcB protein [Sinobacterium caligoides]
MMILFKVLCIFFGASVGSAARFWTGEFFRVKTKLPGWNAILCANLVGSFIIGLGSAWLSHEMYIATLQHSPPGSLAVAEMNFNLTSVLLVTGFCGGITTFSTFSLDTVILCYERKYLQAVLNMGLSIILCTLAVVLGIYLGGGNTL